MYISGFTEAWISDQSSWITGVPQPGGHLVSGINLRPARRHECGHKALRINI
jgi:hypothetical protein